MSSVVSKNRNVEPQKGAKLKFEESNHGINVKKPCQC